MEYEENLLHVPLEAIVRQTRVEGKKLEKEWTVVHKALDTLKGRETKGESQGANAVCGGLDKIAAKLRGVKRKLEDSLADHQASFDVCAARARVAAEHPTGPTRLDEYEDLLNSRADRLVVDYLLRKGCVRSAEVLTEASELHDYVDLKIFQQITSIVEALKAGDCKPALMWCMEHRARLRKHMSDLELELRVCECLQVVRKSPVEAILYTREHIAPLAEDKPEILKNLMTTIVLGVNKFPSPEVLYTKLVKDFFADVISLNEISETPLLVILLQAGLLALNMSRDQSSFANPSDPMLNPHLQALAEGLPVMARKNSCLVCPLSGEVMDDNNPPMVTPKGHIYSESALTDLLAVSSDGLITCPGTRESFEFKDLRKAYIM